MTLRADVHVVRDGFELVVRVEVAPGEVLAVLGPNGSGKTTLLEAIAGLVPLRAGRVVLDGRVLADTAESIAVPTWRRRVALLDQEALLFPHLSAAGNVEFGMRARGVPAREARDAATAALRELGLVELAHRRPAQLSGGQQQRVAIARALAADPAALLLDEPFASLDVEHAGLVRGLLRERLSGSGIPTLLVTHDVADVIALADRAIVIEAGRVARHGAPHEVLAHVTGGVRVEGTVDATGAIRVAEGIGLPAGRRVTVIVHDET